MTTRKKTPIEVLKAAKVGQTVCVGWGDAFSVDRWQQIEDLPDDITPLEAMSIGTLLKLSKTAVSIAHTVTEDGQFCGMLNIPLGWILTAEVFSGD